LRTRSMRAARPARAQQSLPDGSVSFAPSLSARFLAGTFRGGWWWFERVQESPAEGLPFPCKVLQCASQGDAKRRGPYTRAFCRTRRIQGRQTMPAPVPSPCKLFKWSEIHFLHPTLVRYRIRIPVRIGSRFLSSLRTRSLSTMHVRREDGGRVSNA
jgi:hypothetical protein